ncbi:MAG TPA: hypothetical protein VH558_02260 [Pseudolabrys sp.]|jgi:hypothetical protein
MRKSWELQDGTTLIKVVIDTLRAPRSATAGQFQHAPKAEHLISEIGRLVHETERGHTGRQ